MLWVNLIMDTFAALALATEPPTDDLMDRKPQNKDESIISAVMWRNIFGQAIYQVAVILGLLIYGQELFNLPYDKETPFYTKEEFLPTNKTIVYTIVFQCFVFMQCFNQINARKLGE